MDHKHVAVEELEAFARETILAAGEKALTFYGRGVPEVKFDRALGTEAELQLNHFFQEALSQRFPEHQLFDGQQPDDGYTHEARRYLWVFDPLDGMSNFMAGIPIWGMSVALMENFWPVFGFCYMPATDDLFYARAGQVAQRGDARIQVSSQDSINDESVLLNFSRFHQCYHSTFPGKQLNLGCTSAHICYVAMGRAEAALIAHESYQDLAAVRVIMEAAGGKFMRMDGTMFPIAEYLEGDTGDVHLLALAPALFNQVRGCLHHAV
ncbi:MAG: inositol monophosphatase family protein [Desulfobacterales bacterium]|nr:inositol monophosphatase family protein [Desulfobacterales bacterium]